jgi:hypothetical protein
MESKTNIEKEENEKKSKTIIDKIPEDIKKIKLEAEKIKQLAKIDLAFFKEQLKKENE